MLLTSRVAGGASLRPFKGFFFPLLQKRAQRVQMSCQKTIDQTTVGRLFYFDKGIQDHTPRSEWKEAKTAIESDDYKPGDVVEVWDHVFRWDKDCVPSSTMTEWRSRGDLLADKALPSILSSAGDLGRTDLYMRLEAAALGTTPLPDLQPLWAQLHRIDDTEFRYDRAQIARGQAVFYRYAPHILASLLQYSLGAGFSSPLISRVLNLASYLVPPMSTTPEGEAPRITPESNDRTFKRLMETTQFVIDCMKKDALEVGGPGWKAAIRVRLLHATMRMRIRKKIQGEVKRGNDVPFDEARDGTPISQEAYSATLTSFATTPLINLVKVGITPSPQECEDYTALWRVIGYYLGKLCPVRFVYALFNPSSNLTVQVLTKTFSKGISTIGTSRHD